MPCLLTHLGSDNTARSSHLLYQGSYKSQSYVPGPLGPLIWEAWSPCKSPRVIEHSSASQASTPPDWPLLGTLCPHPPLMSRSCPPAADADGTENNAAC